MGRKLQFGDVMEWELPGMFTMYVCREQDHPGTPPRGLWRGIRMDGFVPYEPVLLTRRDWHRVPPKVLL
jgi:hypothetical protein